MIKVTIFAAVATLTNLCGSMAASLDSCVPIDFTTKDDEFADLNTMIKSPKFLALVKKNYDPLTREEAVMDDISYEYMALSLKLSPVIHSMKITGLSSFVPNSINVNGSNLVTINAASSSQVAVNANMSLQVEPMGLSMAIQLECALEQPKVILGAEANMLACAPGVPQSQCANLTVAGLQSELASATTRLHYMSVMKEVLMKFESASVISVLLDFKSISGLTVQYSSPDFMTRSFLKLLPTYVDVDMDKNSERYDFFTSKMSAIAPTVLNKMINSSLAFLFGGTCLSEE